MQHDSHIQPGKGFPHERYSGIQGFGKENSVQLVRDSAYDWNPESTFQWKRIRNPKPGIRNPKRAIQKLRLSWITFITWAEKVGTINRIVWDAKGEYRRLIRLAYWNRMRLYALFCVIHIRNLHGKRQMFHWLAFYIDLSMFWKYFEPIINRQLLNSIFHYGLMLSPRDLLSLIRDGLLTALANFQRFILPDLKIFLQQPRDLLSERLFDWFFHIP